MGLAEKLRETRQELGLNQNDLAMLVKVDRNYITRYETGRVKPAADILYRLAKALGTTMEYLLDQEEDPTGGLSDRELLTKFKQAQYLSDEDKTMLLKLIDAVVNNSKIQDPVKS